MRTPTQIREAIAPIGQHPGFRPLVLAVAELAERVAALEAREEQRCESQDQAAADHASIGRRRKAQPQSTA